MIIGNICGTTKMATVLDYGRVQILCTCRLRSPVTQLYFCKHCLKLRCGRCVSHEVDSHYCPNCLENMPSSEAKAKKNRCSNCLDCPSCKHTLSTRATSIALPPDQIVETPQKGQTKGASNTKKVYYLACGFCRWTSRDLGMADKEVASGAWGEPENPHAKRVGEVLDYYRQLAGREKAERERKKYTRRRTYLHMQEKFLTPTGSRRRSAALLSTLSTLGLKEGEQGIDASINIPEPLAEVDPLDPKIFSQPVILEKAATISQRLQQPEQVGQKVNDLQPRHKHLLIKRSQRCRDCEHNLSKPEFNPSSIKFKIQLVAMHHVPDVRIFLVPKLHHQKESIVTLMLVNPLEKPTSIRMEAMPSGDEAMEVDGDDKPSSAKLTVPEDELSLSARDIAAEFDDTSTDTQEYNDNPEFIQFRKGHKLGVLVKVTPLVAAGDVVIHMKLNYSYTNITPSLRAPSEDSKEAKTKWLHQDLIINLGALAEVQ